MQQQSRHRFSPGDRVVLESTGECGIVVHTWPSDEVVEDCYVAFFGERFPTSDEVPSKPYILRYSTTSLRPASELPSQGSADDDQRQDEGVVAFDVVEVRLLDPKKSPDDQRWLVRGRAWADIHVGDRLVLAGHQAVVESIASYGRECDELNAMVTGEVRLKLLGSGSRMLALEQAG